MTTSRTTRQIISIALMVFGTGVATMASAEPEVPEKTERAVVNVNTATLQQLRLLPGVGPATAQAIIDHRGKRLFSRKEQLLKVRGIGPRTLRRLRPYISIEGPTTLTHKVKLRR